MKSIIEVFNSKPNFIFSVSSSDPWGSSNRACDALNKEGDVFQSCFESEALKAFWCISFSRPVSIESYTISGKTDWRTWQTSWEIR